MGAMVLSSLAFADTSTKAIQVNSFPDIEGHWAYNFITDVQSHGIISGYEDGTFRPNNNVTNAEFLSMTLTAINDKADEPQAGDKWYTEIYNKADELGLINENDSRDFSAFNPNSPITREQASKIVYEALKLNENYDPNDLGIVDSDNLISAKMTDVDTIKDFYLEGTKGSILAGILGGYPDETFKPQNKLTRAESTVLIQKIYDPAVRDDVMDGMMEIKDSWYLVVPKEYDEQSFYMNEKYMDYYNLYKIAWSENDDVSDGFSGISMGGDKTSELGRGIGFNLYKDNSNDNFALAISQMYYYMTASLDMIGAYNTRDYPIQISEYDASSNPLDNDCFYRMCRYLFGSHYDEIMADYKAMKEAGYDSITGYDEKAYDLGNRKIKILRWQTGIDIAATFDSNAVELPSDSNLLKDGYQ